MFHLACGWKVVSAGRQLISSSFVPSCEDLSVFWHRVWVRQWTRINSPWENIFISNIISCIHTMRQGGEIKSGNTTSDLVMFPWSRKYQRSLYHTTLTAPQIDNNFTRFTYFQEQIKSVFYRTAKNTGVTETLLSRHVSIRFVRIHGYIRLYSSCWVTYHMLHALFHGISDCGVSADLKENIEMLLDVSWPSSSSRVTQLFILGYSRVCIYY